MDLIVGIERLAAIAFVVNGLSHLAAPRAWARYFIDMRARGEVAGIHNGLLHIPLGLLIAAFHPVWTWPGIFVTIIGWLLVIKATLHLMWPRLTLRTTAHVSEDKPATWRAAGIASLLTGLFIAWISMRA